MIKWTKEKVIAESKKYNNRTSFSIGRPSAYAYARKNNLLDEMTWLVHSANPLTDNIYCIYGYFDDKNKTVYIGLTMNATFRHIEHCRKGPVFKYFNGKVPNPIHLENNLSATQAQIREGYYVEYYKSLDWTVLNKAKTGKGSSSLGGIIRWSKLHIFQESKKYHSKGEFCKKASRAYYIACKNQWINDMIWLNTHKKNIQMQNNVDNKSILDKYHFTGDPTSKEDVYRFMQIENSQGKMKNECIFKKCFPEIYKDLISMKWDSTWKFSQILLHYFNPYVRCTCITCGKPTKFNNFKYGYYPYCNSKCANSNDDKKLKTKDTVLRKYGVENVFQSDEIKETSKQTCLERYGSEHASQSKEVRDKMEQTCKDRYGVNTPFEMEDFKDKSKATSLSKYHTEHPMQSAEVKKKVSRTYYNSVGYNNPSYNPDVIEKRKQTNFEHYDGLWNTQTEDFIANNHNLFLSRHQNIIDENDNEYIVRCDDLNCSLCDKKIFAINKDLYKCRTSQSRTICPIKLPFNSNESNAEKSLLDYIQSIYKGNIITNDRSIISPQELDIVIPEKNIAIEFNGVFWHSDFNPRIHKNYHRDKSLKCIENGYMLLHIWEDDWNNRNEIVKDYIKSKLGLCSRHIFARKCHIKEIDAEIARNFLNNNHLQGYVNSTYKIGLFYNDELVEVMLAGKLRNMMGSKPKEGCYEIYRLASCKDTEVTGGFSKMLKYFERIYHPKEIITYGDLCYTNGNAYIVSGFAKESLSTPCYSWEINGIRYHRSNFMKHKLTECKEHPELTEDYVMHQRHAHKVWDAGKIKFVKTFIYD